MSAMTVSRQMGSRGEALAAILAEQLNWRLFSRDLINRAALAAGVPQVALAEIDELGLLGLRPSSAEWKAYQKQVQQIIRELADEGDVVIVGRGGQMVLAGRPDVLHVRVVAPLEVRVARLCQEEGLSAEAVRARLEASDKARQRYLKRSHGVRVDDPAHYHVTVNTGLLDPVQAVDLIVRAFRTLAR